jgi:type IV pilus assembly protein PilM
MIGLHLNTLEAAGLTPVAIDIEPLAVGRTLLDLDKKGLANKNVVIVNVGAAITDVGVYKNGILRFPRTIPIAGENFTRAIADQLGITMEAAEEEKRDAVVLMEMLGTGGGVQFDASPAEASPFDFDFDHAAPSSGAAFDLPGAEPATSSSEESVAGGAAFDPYGNAPAATPQAGTPPTPPPAPVPASSSGPDPNDPRYRRRREIFDALLPVLGEFSMEIRRSIDYFRSRYPSDTVDQILLCGGSARIGNLDQYVQYEMGIPTMVADPFTNVASASKQMSRERLAEVAPAFAVALGLAARDAVLGPG